MKIRNAFTVALPPDEAWRLLNDVPRVAPCLPGAELLETREDGGHAGRVAVRLGPVALSFRGSVAYEARDDEARYARMAATGNEERARGTARAKVDFNLAEAEAGSRVTVDTDLALAGSIAQYARGAAMIESTAQVLIDDFSRNLAAMLAAEGVAAEASGPAPRPAPAKPEVSVLSLVWRALRRWVSFGRAKRT